MINGFKIHQSKHNLKVCLVISSIAIHLRWMLFEINSSNHIPNQITPSKLNPSIYATLGVICVSPTNQPLLIQILPTFWKVALYTLSYQIFHLFMHEKIYSILKLYLNPQIFYTTICSLKGSVNWEIK